MIDRETQPHSHLPGKLILVLYFFLGAFSLVIQTIFIREFFVIQMGNELILGIIFSLWLSGVFLGAYTGAKIGKKTRQLVRLLCLGIFLIVILSLVSIILIRLLYSLTGTPAGIFINLYKFIGAAFIIIFPFSFNVGFLFPLASRIQYHKSVNKQDRAQTAGLISRVYIYESIGALVSGIIYSFFLIEQCGSFTNLALFALPLLVIIFLICRSRGDTLFLIITLILITINLALLHPGFNSRLSKFTIKKRWEGFSLSSLVCQSDSKYHHISLGKLGEQYQLYLNGQLSRVFPEKHLNLLTASLIYCQHESPASVLIIGDAVSGLGEQLFRFKPVKIDAIEMDEHLLQVTRAYLPPHLEKILSSPNFSLHHLDGRKYVSELGMTQTKRYDLIFLNIPPPSTLLANRYYTVEFFRDIYRILSPRGTFCFRLTASETYQHGIVSDYTQVIYNTLRKVFPYLVIAPGEDYFFFTSKSPRTLTDKPEILIQRYQNSNIAEKDFALIFHSIFNRERIDRIKQRLSDSSLNAINSDDKPLAVLYFNQISGWYSGSNLEGFFTYFKSLTFLGILSLLFITSLIIYFLYRTISRRRILSGRLSLYITVFFVGFSGFSLHLMLIYSFQNNFGYVFKLIGFLTALFMLGLPLGARLSGNVLKKFNLPAIEGSALIIILLILGCLSIFLPLIVSSLQHFFLGALILYFLIILLGTITGSVYPLVISVLLRDKEGGDAAGIFSALDHLGASLGAFFTGLLLLPIMGVHLTCHLIGIFVALSLLMVIFSKKRTSL